MSEFEIRLTAEAEQNREETMRTLCEAAEEIGKSQEQDFQTLKERKWYQRLLKTVTFSNAAEQKKLREEKEMQQREKFMKFINRNKTNDEDESSDNTNE